MQIYLRKPDAGDGVSFAPLYSLVVFNVFSPGKGTSDPYDSAAAPNHHWPGCQDLPSGIILAGAIRNLSKDLIARALSLINKREGSAGTYFYKSGGSVYHYSTHQHRFYTGRNLPWSLAVNDSDAGAVAIGIAVGELHLQYNDSRLV